MASIETLIAESEARLEKKAEEMAERIVRERMALLEEGSLSVATPRRRLRWSAPTSDDDEQRDADELQETVQVDNRSAVLMEDGDPVMPMPSWDPSNQELPQAPSDFPGADLNTATFIRGHVENDLNPLGAVDATMKSGPVSPLGRSRAGSADASLRSRLDSSLRRHLGLMRRGAIPQESDGAAMIGTADASAQSRESARSRLDASFVGRFQKLAGGQRGSLDKSERRRRSFIQHIIKDNVLQESTFSLLITEEFFSLPFTFALLSTCMSITCLVLALISAFTKGTAGNPAGLPVGVNTSVRIAQFLGLFIGVLMGEEVPAGLELIALGACQPLVLDGVFLVRHRVVMYSLVRLVVGYMFLLSLFFNVAQNKDVLGVFFDVLALQFVEHIDDYTFALAKRGFFGDSLAIATRKEHTVDRIGIFSKESARGVGTFIRSMYWTNAVILVCGLAVITTKQNAGEFRCRSFTISFPDDVWSDAIIVRDSHESRSRHLFYSFSSGGYSEKDDDDETPNTPNIYANIESRQLFYSFFSGVFAEEGTFNGYPRYVEQSKNEGSPFNASTKGAEIKYCALIKSWIFAHIDIKTSTSEENENECSWLMRSPPTSDFDLVSVATNSKWSTWKGRSVEGAAISVACNECSVKSHCNHRGICSDKKCVCDDEHFGHRCEFDMPCLDIESRKYWPGRHFQLSKADVAAKSFQMAYNRPIYSLTNATGLQFSSGHPDDRRPTLFDTKETTEAHPITIFYSGSRWYGARLPPETFDQNFHSFWTDAKSESVFLVSEITDGSIPVDPMWSFINGTSGSRTVPLTNDYDEAGFLTCETPWSAVS